MARDAGAAALRSGYVIWPINDRTFAGFRARPRRRTIAPMDSFGMVALAVTALALLQVAAMNLRGEERTRRFRRSYRSAR